MKKHVSLGHVHFSYLVPEAGIEPARYRYRWILSPVRLPVSPLGQRDNYIPEWPTCGNKNYFVNRDFLRRRKGLMSQGQYENL